MKALKPAISPAALCFWLFCLCVGYSITSSQRASRVVAFKQESWSGYAKTSFPLHMKRWDETLFALLAARAKSEMAEFLKNAEQEANAKPIEGEWKPYTEAVSYLEQFRTPSLVSYLEVANVVQGDARPTVAIRTVNFDKGAGKELTLSTSSRARLTVRKRWTPCELRARRFEGGNRRRRRERHTPRLDQTRPWRL